MVGVKVRVVKLDYLGCPNPTHQIGKKTIGPGYLIVSLIILFKLLKI